MKKSNRPEKQTVKDLLDWASEELISVTNSPRLDAEILLSTVLGRENIFLTAHPEFEIHPSKLDRFKKLLNRRKMHEPIAYIHSYKDFYKHRFYVDKRVLIPRPETEQIVQLALNKIKEMNKPEICIVDICTGSGCIALSVALELATLPETTRYSIFASDVSEDALEVARMNKNKLLPTLPSNMSFEIVKSDLLDYFLEKKIAIDILTANPPYISDAEYETLDRQIKSYEPALALKSGETDMVFIEEINNQIDKLVQKPSFVFIEGRDGNISERAL